MQTLGRKKPPTRVEGRRSLTEATIIKNKHILTCSKSQ